MIDIHDTIQKIRLDLFMKSQSRDVQAAIAARGDHLIYGTLTSEYRPGKTATLAPSIAGVMRKANIDEYLDHSITKVEVSLVLGDVFMTRWPGLLIGCSGLLISAGSASEFLQYKMRKATKITSIKAFAIGASHG